MNATRTIFGGVGLGLVLGGMLGCGTTRWSDTQRTATEQLVITDAIDRAVSQVDARSFKGQPIYLDVRFVTGNTDANYLTSTLRQHLIASGCQVKDKPDDAQFVFEVRIGSLGTNRADLLFGIPSTSIPSATSLGTTTTIPEVPLIKRTAQQGVCKLAVFAYERKSGRPVWQSGNHQVASNAKDVWVFGTGPFQQGTIYDGTKFAGEKFSVTSREPKRETQSLSNWVSQEQQFRDPVELAAQVHADEDGPQQASFQQESESTEGSLPPLPPTPPMIPPPPANPQTLASPNPTAGAIGVKQAYDWARDMKTK